MFINTALLPFLLKIMANSERYKEIFGIRGLAESMNYVLIINIFSSNLIAFIDFSNIVKRI